MDNSLQDSIDLPFRQRAFTREKLERKGETLCVRRQVRTLIDIKHLDRLKKFSGRFPDYLHDCSGRHILPHTKGHVPSYTGIARERLKTSACPPGERQQRELGYISVLLNTKELQNLTSNPAKVTDITSLNFKG